MAARSHLSSGVDRVMGYIDAGRKEGAALLLGGNQVEDPGYFVEPTVFTDVRYDMCISREEIFGPVMSVVPFTEVDEATREANDTTYMGSVQGSGLATSPAPAKSLLIRGPPRCG